MENKFPETQEEMKTVLLRIAAMTVRLRIASEEGADIRGEVWFSYGEYNDILNYIRSLSPELEDIVYEMDTIGRRDNGYSFWMSDGEDKDDDDD